VIRIVKTGEQSGKKRRSTRIDGIELARAAHALH